jgi:glycosyltransferase involved in cell wall biosynthesis
MNPAKPSLFRGMMAQTRSDPASRSLQVVILPPMRWATDPHADPRQAADPQTAESAGSPAPRRMTTRVINPLRRPWNPFAGCHPLFEGLDPVRALHVLLRERHCDAVLAVFEAPAVVLLALRRLFRFTPPIVMLDIGLGGHWAIRDRILDFIVPRLDAVIVLGRNQIGDIQRRWPSVGLVRFVYHRVDTDAYTPQPFAAGGPILTVGEDVGRDFPTLLQAIDGLDARLVAKTGQIHEDHAHVQVVRERLSADSYRALFAAARFVVIPLHQTVNASGVSSLLEAMAMGRAVIVSDSPGIRDYVAPEETALVVPPNDPVALRAAIQRLLGDDVLCQRLGAAGRRFVAERCSHAANTAGIAEVMHEVVGH